MGEGLHKAMLMALMLGIAANAAFADRIFFDAFNGTRLKPHWQQPPARHWEHDVGGGRLRVTNLFHPGVPGQQNVASIEADFPIYRSDEFVLTALLGWAPGQSRMLSVRLWNRDGLVVAMGYDETGPNPLVFVEWPNAIPPTIRTKPAPAPGLHEFKLVSDFDGLALYVDGRPQTGFGGARDQPISRVEVVFAGTEGVAFTPLEIGLARIVPGPGVLFVLTGGLGIIGKRRR